METAIFDEDSDIDETTDIDNFIPPHPGWNYVRVNNHQEDFIVYDRNPVILNYGKWLLFVPHENFVIVFRQLARLAKELKLTEAFKASGTPANNEHVFCIYCTNYKNIKFVRKIATVLHNEGFLRKYGYRYRDGTKAIYFKTDATTSYRSNAKGMSLTLFRFTDKRELSVKEFDEGGKPSWKLVGKGNDSEVVRNFEMYLDSLKMENLE